MRKCVNAILEGLSDGNGSLINESTIHLDDNIDEKKFKELEKKLNKAGFTFKTFTLYKLDGGHFSRQIVIEKLNNRDNTVPLIDIDLKGFYVHPAFMGNLSSSDARKMATNLSKAADLVDELNKINFESYMTKDAPWEG